MEKWNYSVDYSNRESYKKEVKCKDLNGYSFWLSCIIRGIYEDNSKRPRRIEIQGGFGEDIYFEELVEDMETTKKRAEEIIAEHVKKFSSEVVVSFPIGGVLGNVYSGPNTLTAYLYQDPMIDDGDSEGEKYRLVFLYKGKRVYNEIFNNRKDGYSKYRILWQKYYSLAFLNKEILEEINV